MLQQSLAHIVQIHMFNNSKFLLLVAVDFFPLFLPTHGGDEINKRSSFQQVFKLQKFPFQVTAHISLGYF